MAWQSTVPAVLNALVAAFRAEPVLTGLVRDGPELRDEAALEAVFVGHTGADDDTAAQGTLSRQGLAIQPDREPYSILCAASVLNGSSDITAARVRVYELFAAVGAALAADHTLGGIVMAASLGEWSLAQEQLDLGAMATITFNVDIDAWTRT